MSPEPIPEPSPESGPDSPGTFDPARFARRAGDWLREAGPESDVVFSCRVRLARNLARTPFVVRLNTPDAEKVCGILREALTGVRIDGETHFLPMRGTSQILRLVLRERHLISRDLAPVEENAKVPRGRAVAFGDSETVSAMVNEEDHLRLQAMAPGFDLDLAWQRVSDLDRALEERLDFAATEKLGYLTGCPTNVGTGMRASVMMHLPALSMVRSELEKVFTAAQRTGMAVRGLHGEGSRAAGDFYQVSNQITLGRSEDQLLDDLRALVPSILEFERRMREALLEDRRAALTDRVCASLATLRTATSMPTDEALGHLSNLRLGHHLGLVHDVNPTLLGLMLVRIQRGHLQALERPDDARDPAGHLLEASERDRLRAAYLRRELAIRN